MTTIASEPSLPAPIDAYLTRYVRLRRRRALLRGLGIAAAVTVAWVMVCCALDRALPLPPWARVGVLSMNLAIVVAILLRPVWRWIRRDVDFDAAAADIEQRDNRFGQRLQTVTSQLLSPPSRRASAQLLAYLTAELSAELAADHPGRLLPRRPVVRPWMAAGALAAVALALAAVPAIGLPTLLLRYAAPFASIAPPTTTHLAVEPRDIDLIEGQTVSIEAIVDRGGDSGATLHYRKAGQEWAELRMRPSRPQRFDAVLGPVDTDIRYYVTAGDARSETHHIRVVKRPVVSEFRIRYTYPPYLKRPAATVVNSDGYIEAPVGTQLTMSVVASEPLASASLALGDRTLALTRGDDAHTFRGSFTIDRSMDYSLEMVSTSKVAGGGSEPMRINAVPDAAPVVQLQPPPSPLRLRPRDTVHVDLNAADDHGIAAITLRATRSPRHIDFSGAQPNLALRRPTTQSSTALGARAERAVDGDTRGDFHAGSVTHTELDPAPWWEVDLGQSRPLWCAEIWNRSDAVPERLSQFVVFSSDLPFSSNDPAALRNLQGVHAIDIESVAGRPTVIDLLRLARYVRVQLQGQEYLSLAEVRVLGFRRLQAGGVGTLEAAVPVSGDARRQDRRLTVKLAALGARLGERVTLSVVVTDAAGNATESQPILIDLMPHSHDPAAFARADALQHAADMAGQITGCLDTAIARASATQPTTAPATEIGRRIIDAAERAFALQTTLVDVVDDLGGNAADAVATAHDAAVVIAAAGEKVYHGLSIDNVPTAADIKRLTAALEYARLAAEHLAGAAAAERAGALLRDVCNVAALDAAAPEAIEHVQTLREAQQSLRAEVEARLKPAGLSLSAPDIESRLREQMRTNGLSMAAADLSDDPDLLIRRLSLASQIEGRRRGGDVLRASDLRRIAQLATTNPAAAARLLDPLQEHHAVQRRRARGGIVLLHGLWADAVSRAVRAQLPALPPPLAVPPAFTPLARVRDEQIALLRTTASGEADPTHLGTRQERVAAAVERLVRAGHELASAGRLPDDSRLRGIRAAVESIRVLHAADPSPNRLLATLAPFQPETIEAMRAIEQSLRPALKSEDPAKKSSAVTAVEAALAASLRALIADDPLIKAYAAAHRAAVALRDGGPGLDAAIAQQRLAARALDEAIEDAARDAARTEQGGETLAAAAPAVTPRATRSPPSSSPTTLPAAMPAHPPGYSEALDAYFQAIAPQSSSPG